MNRSLVNNLDERQTPVAGFTEIAIEDQRSIDGGWSLADGVVVGAALAAGVFAAPALLVVAAAAGAYAIATN